ncbi:TraM recognition domain-containing protein, partial [Candidatus Saccharibacteria bacterium]|nr:TraM recognition domain-containing protein [Candidatus Saccharibacteria bacterium]
IFRLLNDGKYAKKIIKDLEDEDLKAFWKNEFGKAGGMQKVKMSAGITAKIGRFLFSASARTMLEKEKSDIDFSEVLDGKILICNFSKGRLGEDTSSLFGTTILAKLQLASLRRSETKQKDRRPFYLYVDEFQNFATMSFTQMLSEARKYKLYLTMAEQSTQQQDDQKMVEVILANVGTIVAFRTGSPRDEELILPRFEPYIEKGEISNLPAYNFYCRISGKETNEPNSGETLLVG